MNESEQNGETPQNGNDVGFAVAAPDLRSDDALAAAAQLGCTRLNRELVNELAQIGVDADSRGLLKIASGAVILSLQAGVELLQEVVTIAKDPKSKPRMKLNASIAGAGLMKSIHSGATSVKADGLAANVPVQKPRVKRVLQMPAA